MSKSEQRGAPRSGDATRDQEPAARLEAAAETEAAPGPLLSIVIPVFNEERILVESVEELRRGEALLGWPFELVLAENGSTDRTRALCEELARGAPNVRVVSVGEPNYGLALRTGILAAQGELVACEEIDLCDTEFHARAVELLRTTDAALVIGSKLAEGADDSRPWQRHVASLAYTALLRAALGFRGTDTHGLKVFRRSALAPILEACVIDKDVFASELVVRAARAGLVVRELPVCVREKRPPTVKLLRRVPRVLRDVARLAWLVRGPSRLRREPPRR